MLFPIRVVVRADHINSLQKLVQTLNRNERKVVSEAIARKDDPFSGLPFELLLQIFSHLDCLKAWALQRVCKRWHKILSSDDFLRSALSRWQTHHPSDSARSVELISHDQIQNETRHMRALLFGDPFTFAVVTGTGPGLSGGHAWLSPQKLDFKGRRIAYISSHQNQGDAVFVRDLVDGKVRVLRGEAREQIMAVVLTTTLVAFVTFEGYLYYMKLLEPGDKILRRRLPSCRIRAWGGADGIIALADGGDRHDSPSVTQVLLLDAENSRLRSVEVKAKFKDLEGGGRKLNSCSLLINSIEETIDIFSLMTSRSMPPKPNAPPTSLDVVHLRTSYSGEILCSNLWQERTQLSPSFQNYDFTMSHPTATGYMNRYRIQVCQGQYMGDLPLQRKFDLIFDIERANFLRDENVEWFRCHYRFGVNRDYKEVDGLWVTPEKLTDMYALWKGRLHKPYSRESLYREYMHYMNDTFMVILEVNVYNSTTSRIRIFCYDEQLGMVGAHSTGLWKDKRGEDALGLRVSCR